MHRTKDHEGVVYYLTAGEDETLQSFRNFIGVSHTIREWTDFLGSMIPKLYELLTDSRGVWDPKHDQDVACARFGCGHPYERHFDSYASMEPVGCKYCGSECRTFVEPT
jgi:hypothetical protein